MATVDDRVVSMAFENSKFESNVRTTLASLEKLQAALKFQNAGKGLQGISAAAAKTDLSPIARGIDALNSKFGALRVAGVAVMSHVAISAAQAGAAIVKSFTFDPVVGGLHEYESQIQSVQTILANTQAAGTTLSDVNKALSVLNHYADKTIYNFGQMTKNIGTFTAAGVDLKTATGSIKGIANIAALSGSSAEQASTAMYQLSQAISAGRVSLQDWNSVVNAGMGGSVFQRALAQTAVAMGKLDENALTLSGSMKNVKINGQSFRESIMAAPGKQSWLSGDVLTNTLQQFSGELSKAELKAQGFTDAQIKAIQKQAKAAVDAATTVKTFSQLLDTTREAIGSGWAKTWQIIFGNFGEAKTLFTGISNAVSGFVGRMSKARNSLLQDWKDLGGRDLLIQSFKEAFEALGRILEPIKKAFHDIFPPKTGKDLLALTDRFHDFVQILKIGPETVENLRRIFRGFFAILDIGKQIISGVFSGIKVLFNAIGDGSGNFLDLGGNIGDMIVAFRDWLKEGDKIKTFFETLGLIMSAPLRVITFFIDLIGGGVTTAVGGMTGALGPAEKAAGGLASVWERVIGIFEKIKTVVQPVIQSLVDTVKNMAGILADAIRNADFSNVFAALQVALTGGIFLAIRKALGQGLKVDIGQGLFGNMSKTLASFSGTLTGLSGAFKGLNGSLIALQNNIKANTLLQISIAVGILAASLLLLSTIKPKQLDKAMSAVTVSLGQLMTALFVMGKAGAGGIAKLPVMAASLILLSGAIGALSLSLLLLSTLDWEEIAKGLAGVTGLLVALSIAIQPLSKAGPGFVIAGAGLTALGFGLIVLAGAVKVFSLMDWAEMGKGLAGVAAALGVVAVASRLISPGILLIGPGLIAAGIGLMAIGAAVKIFASMSVGELAKGILGIAGALVAIGIAVVALPPTLPLTAAGLILVGIGLASVGSAIALMGNMDTGTIVKGIIGIGAALGVLALGLTAMSGAIPGTIALLGAAAALAILVPLIGVVAALPFGLVLKGIGLMVGAIVALGIAGIVAAPGVAALGVALLALGAGVYLISAGLSKLGTEGGKGIAVALAAMAAFVAALPMLVVDFLKGLVEILAGIAKLAPEIVKSAIEIVKALAMGLVTAIPHIQKAAIAMVAMILKVLRKSVPDIIRTAFVLINALLKGIERNIGKITKTVGNIIVKFLKALTSGLPKLIDSGADLIVALLKGIAKNIGKVVKAGVDIIVKLVKSIANGLPKIAKAGIDIPLKLIKGIASKFGQVVKTGAETIIKFIKGVGNKASDMVKAGVNAAIKFVNALTKGLAKLANKGADAIIKLIHSMADTIRTKGPELRAAFYDLGTAIMEGLIDGMESLKDKVFDLAGEILGKVGDVASAAAGVFSPSRVFIHIGKMLMLGLSNGITSMGPKAVASSERAATDVITAFTSKVVKLTKGQKAVLNELGMDLMTVFQFPMLGVDQTLDRVQQSFADMLERIETRLSESQSKINAMVSRRHAANKAVSNLQKKKAELEEGKENKKQKQKLKTINKELHRALKDQNEVMKKTNGPLKKERELRDRLLAGKSTLAGFTKEKQELRGLALAYDQVAEQLEDAKQALDDAKQARADAAESITGQFTELPEIIKEDINDVDLTGQEQLKNYLDALQKQVDATKKYKETLAKLRAAGLDNTTYQKLLDEGVGGQDFADAILAGGSTAIDSLKSLDDGLLDQATTLANDSAAKLYDAGVQAAQGLVDGLESKKSDLFKAMNKLALIMIRAIKDKLKIKSPSEAFAELGKFTMLGMARGLHKSSKKVTDAVTGVSKDALDAMKDKMRQVSAAVANEIDPNPTIAPVLDLTDIQNGSKNLKDMMNVVPITAAASYGKARSISSAELAAKLAQSEELARLAGINFTQNNYSPEALSAIEIYRRTQNQLAQARPVLT